MARGRTGLKSGRLEEHRQELMVYTPLKEKADKCAVFFS